MVERTTWRAVRCRKDNDVIAAMRNDMRAIGVTWGYGSAAELTGEGAVMLCDSPSKLVDALTAL